MHRNVTAIYRTYATADLVRQELKSLGISPGYIHVIPDTDNRVLTEDARGDHRYFDQLYDLHLPDEDLRTYQQSVRNGDYVVSAEVDQGQIERVQEIMRRPESEAYDLDQRSGEFHTAELYPHSDPTGRRIDEDRIAQRDPDHADPYTRSYRRSARLNERRD